MVLIIRLCIMRYRIYSVNQPPRAICRALLWHRTSPWPAPKSTPLFFCGEPVTSPTVGRCAVALVVVCHGGSASFFQGESRLGTVQCLNLAFLVAAQYQ